ncbi:hypothetical protein LJC59_06900, partial [Desulfovibrio sp. OttesenSCG-928-A18]|nr:hypothetical protein [Desulfovibrio sp. OttesenSCG-928-A18]
MTIFPELVFGTAHECGPSRAGKDLSALRHRAGHDPRCAALHALFAVLFCGRDSQAALDAVLGDATGADALQSLLVPSDRALCTELLYGSLRHFLLLDAFAANYLHKAAKLPLEMRLAMVQSLYEAAFTRSAHHAVVNWTVTLVRNRFGKVLGNVANGALRAMFRDLPHLARPGAGQDGNAPEELALRFGMPLWITAMWAGLYPEQELLALLAASQQRPVSGIRLNAAREDWQAVREDLGRAIKAGGAAALPAPSEYSLAFEGKAPPGLRQFLAHGRASRQSPAVSALLRQLEPASWPQPLWDCCAGRGGKTLALLEQGIPVAIASDVSQKRLGGLPEEYQRLQLSSPPCPEIRLMAADAAGADAAAQAADASYPVRAPAADSFGTILLDAPCSGLGTLARRPEIRFRRGSEDITQLAALQAGLLDAVWPCLR